MALSPKVKAPHVVVTPGELPSTQNHREFQNRLVKLLQDFEKKLQGLESHFSDVSQYPQLLKIIQSHLPGIYQVYDTFLNNVLNSHRDKITCGKNCGGCCNHFVASVEPFELIYIDAMIKKGDDYGVNLFKLNKRHQIFDALAGEGEKYHEDAILFEYLKKELPCPFLNSQGECGVYSYRPMPCRMFYSLSHPRFCVGSKTLLPENKNFIIELDDDVEVIISQITHWFRELELPNLFFPGLLKVNEIFGRYV